jgi:ribonuclease P protein component
VLPDYAAKRLAKADTRKQLKNRYGITVTTKIGGATVRSRCRRIIRAGIAAIEKRGVLKQGFLIVIAARSKTPSLKSTDIEKALDTAFIRLGMYES